MKNLQKGFAISIIIAVIALLLVGSVIYIINTKLVETPINIEPVFCTMDAMQCPDGSWVGRTGPNCEFICPTEKPIELMDLPIYIQDKSYVATSSCSVTKKVIYQIPKTTAVADASLKILFTDELSVYGKYKSVSLVGGVAKIMLEDNLTKNGAPISSLSSCESSHLLAVLNDTLKQYSSIKSIQLLSPLGIIEF